MDGWPNSQDSRVWGWGMLRKYSMISWYTDWIWKAKFLWSRQRKKKPSRCRGQHAQWHRRMQKQVAAASGEGGWWRIRKVLPSVDSKEATPLGRCQIRTLPPAESGSYLYSYWLQSHAASATICSLPPKWMPLNPRLFSYESKSYSSASNLYIELQLQGSLENVGFSFLFFIL